MQTAQIIHAYKQAPWRVQRQWIGVFLLAVIGAAMVAALYLDVTAHAALAGRQIQEARWRLPPPSARTPTWKRNSLTSPPHP